MISELETQLRGAVERLPFRDGGEREAFLISYGKGMDRRLQQALATWRLNHSTPADVETAAAIDKARRGRQP